MKAKAAATTVWPYIYIHIPRIRLVPSLISLTVSVDVKHHVYYSPTSTLLGVSPLPTTSPPHPFPPPHYRTIRPYPAFPHPSYSPTSTLLGISLLPTPPSPPPPPKPICPNPRRFIHLFPVCQRREKKKNKRERERETETERQREISNKERPTGPKIVVTTAGKQAVQVHADWNRMINGRGCWAGDSDLLNPADVRPFHGLWRPSCGGESAHLCWPLQGPLCRRRDCCVL